MRQIALITIKGIFRDRVFKGIAMSTFFFLFIPTVSSLSMRQVVELATTLSLSLTSLVLLLLSVFLGGVSVWQDMERRYTFSVLGLPLKRSSYLLGKFLGIAAFLFLTTFVLGCAACIVIRYTGSLYPPQRPVVWSNVLLALFFMSLKYVLLVAVAFLFSSVSTSFFLPIFGTLSIYFVGNSTQQVHDFLKLATTHTYSPFIKGAANALYYVLPNFSCFDLSVNAIYGIAVSARGNFLTMAYFAIYTALTLTISTNVFSRRELQ
jgi:Cu-processing system permease protein